MIPTIDPNVPGMYLKLPILKIVQKSSDKIKSIELFFIIKIYSCCAKDSYSIISSYKS